jgi:hypothetical protein
MEPATMVDRICLLCGGGLAERPKPEHILLNALGGKSTTQAVTCTACNETSGASIDAELAHEVEFIRNLLRLPKGDGRAAPSLEVLDPVFGRVALRPGLQPELKQTEFDVSFDSDELRMKLSCGDRDALNALIPHASAKAKVPEAVLRQILREDGITQQTHYLSLPIQELSFGSSGALRAIAKMLLVLLASRLGPARVRPFATRAIEFVKAGCHESDVCLGFHCRPLPDSATLEREFGPFFSALVVTIAPDGTALGYFRLYNGFARVFSLAERLDAEAQTFSLINNPQDPRRWSSDPAYASGVSAEFLKQTDADRVEEVGREFFIRVNEAHRRAAREQALTDITDQVASDLGLEPDQPLSDAQLDAYAAEVSDRLTRHIFRMPTSRPIKLD